MNLNLNVDEVFELAEQIERNGAIFYRKAASFLEDATAVAKLEELAIAEDRHEAVFRGLREQLVRDDARISVYDKDDIVALHLQALAGREVFVVGQEPSDVLKGTETFAQVVKIAIGKEWDSILFYCAVRDLVGSEEDKIAINEIIRQEERHVKELQECL